MNLFHLFVARRHLWARRKQAFLSLVTFISISGVVVGVMALIIVMGIMNGFEQDLTEKILGNRAHVVVNNAAQEGISDPQWVMDTAMSLDHVVAATPYVITEGILTTRWNTKGVLLRGIDPETAPQVYNIEDTIIKGGLNFDLEGVIPHQKEKMFRPEGGIVLGVVLADYLGADLNDIVTVSLPTQTWSPLRPIGTVDANFQVVGIFDSGVLEFDMATAYLSLEKTQEMMGLEGLVNGVEIKVDDIYRAEEVAEKLQQELPSPHLVQWWKETNRTIFIVMILEKVVMFIILALIVLVAALNIAGSLLMTVIEKTRDIGILRSIGATKRMIRAIFIWEGTLVGVIGTFLGVILGLVGAFVLERYFTTIMPSSIVRYFQESYYLETLPVSVSVQDVVVIALAAMVISVLATLYPAVIASRLNPVEAIRYE